METKNNPLISVLICSYNDADFVGASLYALSKLTCNPFVAYVLDNNSNPAHSAKLKSYTQTYPWVELERKETGLRSSQAHAAGLNYLVTKINTPYACIMDADFSWLRKNWDQILIDQLNDKIKAAGTQTDNPIRSPNFPVIFGLLFDSACFKELDINFEPKDIAQGLDVAWEMEEKFLAHGWQGQMLPMKNTREYRKGPFFSILGCAEYYSIDNPQKIFGCHFGRGAYGTTYKYLKGQSNFQLWFFRLPYFGQLLLNFLTKKERKRWINIARKIVDQEAQ